MQNGIMKRKEPKSCITPSMPRKGNPYDNAMAENFFSILKTECIYRHKPKSIQEANELIDRYIYFYNHERIQTKREWHRCRCATPLKTQYPTWRLFVLSAQSGAFQSFAGGRMVRDARNNDRSGCRSFQRSFPGTALSLFPGRLRRALPDPAGTGSRPDGQWRGPEQRK